MVKQQNSSASLTKICFLRLWHDSFPDPSCNFHGFVHDFSCGPSSTLTAPCSTIIVTLLQLFLITFAASCCNVSMTLFRILHVTFALRARLFPGLLYSCHSFVLHCQHGSSLDLDNPPSFCQPSSDRLPRSTTPRILHAFILILSSRVHTC